MRAVLGDDGVACLAKALPNLEVLDLSGLPLISSESLRTLNSLNKLSSLSLWDCPRLPPQRPMMPELALRPSLRAAIARADAFERSYFT
jgi:hypothetical protein